MFKFARKAVVCLAATGLLLAVPAQAAPTNAESLRHLDIMLMVTSLRCRTTADNFQADFQAFEAAHMGELNAAAAEMRDGMVSRLGAVGANRALDRISTGMANQYGQGHPWLDCADLKMVARSLAAMRGSAALAEAADQLLTEDGSGIQLAWARR